MEKNFNGYVLFGKLFRESSGNVTLPKKAQRLHAVNEKGSIHIESESSAPGFDPHWWHRLVPWAGHMNSSRVLV